MADVRITIDGKEVLVPANTTVLKAAEAAGVKIATLCAHPAIEPLGACRVCLVEIEKQRVLQPACTFPVSEGMIVRTDTDKTRDARRFVLQLLFSERNHFCMFCQMSGSCELQTLAYENGLDHWEYDRPFNHFAVDASRKYFAMDHNRCILCRRCVRACDEIVGNGTLGLKNRGANTLVVADMDVPFGDSSCVSCGTCLQVCPTGALMDRASAYMGATADITRVKSRCMACAVGCGVELIVRDGRVIRVEGDWDASPNKGLLCEIGRFHPMHEKRTRARRPLVRRGEMLVEATWDEALQAAAAGLKAAGNSVATVAGGHVTNEEATAFAALPGVMASLYGAPAKADGDCLAPLDEADLYVVVDTDLGKDHQVAGLAIKRAARHRGARLIVLSDTSTGMDDWAMARWTLAEADKAAKLAAEAQSPVILYTAAGQKALAALAAKVPSARTIALAPAGNSLGLAALGYGAAPAAAMNAYVVVAAEEPGLCPDLKQSLDKARFVVAVAAYREPWDQVADVILPMPATFEKAGTFVNTEGETLSLVAAMTAQAPSATDTAGKLAALMR